MHGRCFTELSERLPPLTIPTRVTRGTTNAHRTSKKWNSLNELNFPVAYNMKKLKAAANLYLKDRALGIEAQTVKMC